MTESGAGAGGWRGGDVAEGVTCVLAENPGPLTLDGTNTWLLAGREVSSCVVIDPGPDDAAHLQSVVVAGAERGWDVEGVLLTHGHADHAGGCERLADLTGAWVRAARPEHCRGGNPLLDEEVIEVAGLRIEVVSTPGHTADSVSFLVAARSLLLTGDTVLGRGTSFVAHPDGRLADYLMSLDRLAARTVVGPVLVLPGHGPVVPDGAAVIAQYRAHRLQRLAQVRAARAGGAQTADAVLDAVYGPLSENLRPAALASTLAQLAYLDAYP